MYVEGSDLKGAEVTHRPSPALGSGVSAHSGIWPTRHKYSKHLQGR